MPAYLVMCPCCWLLGSPSPELFEWGLQWIMSECSDSLSFILPFSLLSSISFSFFSLYFTLFASPSYHPSLSSSSLFLPLLSHFSLLFLLSCFKYLKRDLKRKTNTIRYHLCVESKIWHKRTYLRNRNRLTDIENRLVVAKGEEGWGRDGLGVWD